MGDGPGLRQAGDEQSTTSEERCIILLWAAKIPGPAEVQL